MKVRLLPIRPAVAVAMVGLFPMCQAGAQTFSATLNGHSNYTDINGTMDDGGFTQLWPSGVMSFTIDSTGDTFEAFCVDPYQGAGYGESIVYTAQDASTLENYDTVARLVGGYLDSSQTALDAAAVYWAIMEVTGEGALADSLLSGVVRITDTAGGSAQQTTNQTVATMADNYLANVASFEPAEVVLLTNPTRQDVFVFGSGVDLVPEPSSLAILSLCGMFLVRRRR